LLGEALDETHPMLIDPSDQIVGYANVKCAANSVGQSVDPIASLGVHRAIIAFTGSSACADDDTEIDGTHP
jgi:hypothetical protein